MGKWGQIVEDLVTLIEDKLVLYVDKVRFRATCESWNSIPPKMPNLQANKHPWLFHEVYDSEASHGLFHPLDKNVYHLNLLPEDDGSMLKGSSNGWLVTVDDNFGLSNSPDIYLTNPLTRTRIELPSIHKFDDEEIYDPDELDDYDERLARKTVDRIVLSSSPLKDDCLVVAFHSDRILAYCKCNDEKWTSLFEISQVEDIMFYKGQLHVLLNKGELLVFESMKPMKFALIASKVRDISILCYTYLVESSDGELMMVIREFSECLTEHYGEGICHRETTRCLVYKHDSVNLRWLRMESIDDQVIFVGRSSHSISVLCCDVPELKGNKIYFTDETCIFHPGISEIGVFNLDNGSVEYISGFEFDQVVPPSFWFKPSLC